MKSPTIYAALRERYRAPEHALFFERLDNGTGSSIRRYADALAMNLFHNYVVDTTITICCGAATGRRYDGGGQ